MPLLTALEAGLAHGPSVPAGLVRVSYPTGLIDLQGAIERHIVGGGFTPSPLPLATLHCRVSREHQQTDERGLNGLSVRVAAAPPELSEAYLRLIKFVAREVLQQDVLFEANPFVRFYFPGPTQDGYRSPEGTALSHHSDTLFGDAFEQINCWVPLEQCGGTNTLQCAPFQTSIDLLTRFAKAVKLDFDRFVTGRDEFFRTLCADLDFRREVLGSCSSMDMEYGELLVFDARTIHGTLDNQESRTRVSIDFRLLPVSAYWANRRGGTSRPRMARRLRGHYWDSRRAFELC